MQIKWNNLITFLLFVIGSILLIAYWPVLLRTLAAMREIGPGHGSDEKTFGLIILGIVGAILVAIVKILTHGK